MSQVLQVIEQHLIFSDDNELILKILSSMTVDTDDMTSVNMSQFPGWLETVVKQFSSLEPDQQTVTLNQLISCCGSQQLWHLQQKLPDFLYRDFIK